MPTVTLANLTARVLSRVDTNTLLYNQIGTTAAINEAIKTTNLITGYIQVSIPIATLTRPNQVWYNVPQGILFPLRVQFENTYLEPMSFDGLGLLSPYWQVENTVSTGKQVSNWVKVGLTKFGIHPADSVGGNDLIVTGVAEPVPLVSGSDTISFPNEFSEILEDLAVVALVLKEGGKIFADAQVLYQKAISKLRQFSRFESLRQPAQKVELVSPR